MSPSTLIVTPALADANNGNWHTAARWARFLRGAASVSVARAWDGEPVDSLIALHARKSADSIARFARAHPRRGLAVVLTGTDLYHDLDVDTAARASLEFASHLVVLQPLALRRLPPPLRAKARVVLPSAAALRMAHVPRAFVQLVAVGHLRAEKDPLTLLRALQRLDDAVPWRVDHLGEALDPALADAAREAMAREPRYRWLGGVPPDAARRHIARADALVHPSRIEGAATVVIEALRSNVPVLASRIDGNLGLLGEDHPGFFPAGDADALAALIARFCTDAGFADRVRSACADRAPAFRPALERAALRRLLAELCTACEGSPPGCDNPAP